MEKNEIYREKNYRIIRVLDEYFDFEELKGDMFCPEANPDKCPVVLLDEEKKFEDKCLYGGVYGYILERWNAEIGQGWEVVESCHGFAGLEDHYIIDEYKELIK